MDLASLAKINREIPLRENAGDRSYFEARLAPSFVIRRAVGGVVDSRARFLKKLTKGGDPRRSRFKDAHLLIGKERAISLCMVARGDQLFHNLRLFVRDPRAPEGWLLLAWANEPA